MNLLHDPWMPVRDAQGQRHWITPDQLADPRWLAFDADRPDFNGALAQFAIGLLQTTTPVADVIEWRGLMRAPPSAETLKLWFAPVAAAFDLDCAGRRFMQDAELAGQGGELNEISGLLIESPGANTIELNKDHFVKRAQVNALCPACTAMALFTLQLNAPAGGQGNRTGLRGGGPLTTLLMAPPGGTLWHNLWMNVRDRPAFLAQGGDPRKTDLWFSLPWLAPITVLQANDGELAQAQVHPAHVFWAMPRRIFLDFEKVSAGTCDCCRRSTDRLVTHYGSKNYGLNYKGIWNHPLSPYYETKEGWLPIHPQPDGLGYHHWLGWVLGAGAKGEATRAADIVVRAVNTLHRQTGGLLRLWTFGHDMDNMKARCWYESTLPLYGLVDCDLDARQNVQAEVGRWLTAAELASDYLLSAVRDAWLPDVAKSRAANSKKLVHVKAALRSSTELPFYRHLQVLIEAASSGTEHPALATRQAWHATLARTALRLFDEAFAGAGVIERQNPRRTALAHKQLVRNLHGPKLKQALGLPVDEPTTKPARKAQKRTAKEAA